MKAAYVSAGHDVPVFGNVASSVHVQETLRAFARAGITVDLFAASYGGAITREFSGIRMWPLPPLPRGEAGEREATAYRMNAAVRELLKEQHEKAPYSLIYERHSLWSHAGMEFAREFGLPGVLEINAPLLDEAVAAHALSNRNEAEDAVMRAFRAAPVLTAVSRELAHLIEDHPSARNKVHVVPNAVDPARFLNAAPLLNRARDACVIGTVGALRPWQGLMTLLHAFQLLTDVIPNAQLVIVGEGPEREPLQREIAARQLENRVALLGSVPPHQIPGVLASLDIAVAPYPARAGFYLSPIKVFEFMAAGLPVVAGRIGQVGQLIEHGVTGVLVPPGNTGALAEAVLGLAQDPVRAKKLGGAARSRVQTEFNCDRTMARILHLAGLSRPAGV
jgi:glycosyltransferase involved in cell wall biosynthesis